MDLDVGTERLERGKQTLRLMDEIGRAFTDTAAVGGACMQADVVRGGDSVIEVRREVGGIFVAAGQCFQAEVGGVKIELM